jgi:hypothetical protein
MPLTASVTFVAIPIDPPSGEHANAATLMLPGPGDRAEYVRLTIEERSWWIGEDALLNALAALRAAKAPARCVEIRIGCGQ